MAAAPHFFPARFAFVSFSFLPTGTPPFSSSPPESRGFFALPGLLGFSPSPPSTPSAAPPEAGGFSELGGRPGPGRFRFTGAGVPSGRIRPSSSWRSTSRASTSTESAVTLAASASARRRSATDRSLRSREHSEATCSRSDTCCTGARRMRGMAVASAACASADAAASTAVVVGSSIRSMARPRCSGCAVSEAYAVSPKSHQDGGDDMSDRVEQLPGVSTLDSRADLLVRTRRAPGFQVFAG